MKRKLKFSPKPYADRTEQFHKYLKPGALAQMRDSQISAKWYRFNSLSQIYLRRTSPLPSSPLSTIGQSEIDVVDDFPSLAGRGYGPFCLKRKKLAAIKATWFPSPNLQTPTTDITRDPVVDVFNSDVAAH
ncbi:uncharacterized protein LOC120089036 [Benincasa hispida]|uniref:uncharacterized protein LOC120089036 n=1 Tax=Benincasa hispida TaxID=102211 RepID=UPI001902B180|nr:uncharacterized protein LOC120089036 [Benincasa hispida]